MKDPMSRSLGAGWTRVLARALRRGTCVAAALFAVTTVGSAAHAQTETTTVRGARPGRGLGRAAGGRVPSRAPGPQQQALAKQVRQAFAGVVRSRLGLSDEQVRRLQATDQRFQKQRNQITRAERQTRLALAAALADSVGTPDQAKISQYMDELIEAQHKRADLLEAEQKELGAFLTPLQRARYQALREQLNRRVRAMAQQGGRANRGAEPPEK